MLELSCGDVYTIECEGGLTAVISIVDCYPYKVSYALEIGNTFRLGYGTPVSVSCAILSGCMSYLG